MTYTRSLLLILALCSIQVTFGQQAPEGEVQDSLELDDRYREDQFYAGVTYNVPIALPSGGTIRGVSGGINFGYLRDMPVNKQRNVAFAAGLGLSFDQYGQNLFINEDASGSTIYQVLDEDFDYNSNRLSVYTIDLPIEFRWRTSTAAYEKFWRVYFGVRFGYAFHNQSKLKVSGNQTVIKDINEFEPFRTGLTVSLGYSTFNFYGYYELRPFFSGATTTAGEMVDFKTLKIGLIFYIL